MSNILGKRIRALRLEWQLSQSELSVELGISRNFVSELESGTKLPSLPLFIKLCEILETTPNYLLGFDD